MVQTRLNKLLAQFGIASRRKSEELIFSGKVRVNNKTITNPAEEFDDRTVHITVNGESITNRTIPRYYLIMNKPAGCICSHDDPDKRTSVYEYIRHKDLKQARLFTVGRLDIMSRGLLLLTNDGDFANIIMHPRYNIQKKYRVEISSSMKDVDLARINKGIKAFGVSYAPGHWKIERRTQKRTIVTVTLNEGKKNEIRNICRHFKYTINDIQRIRVGPFKLGRIDEGNYSLIKGAAVRSFIHTALKNYTRESTPNKS